MNILIANWSWYPSGGDWTYIKSICDLYEAQGHTIIPFSVKNEKNFSTEYEKYFLNKLDYKQLNQKKTIKSAAEVLVKSIYSFEAKRKLATLLKENKVDIAQLNNINNYQTPSIISVLNKNKIPIVWRVLDYKLICPNRALAVNDKVCEACFKHKYYNCATKKCIKGSRLASIAAAFESYTYWLLPHYKKVDMFLFQSEFSRDMFVKFGYDKKKTHIIENPFDSKNIIPEYKSEDYILYFGRLEKIKGIYTLLNAMKLLPHIKLKLVGDGTERDNCVKYIKDNSLSNVTYLGPKWNEELDVILQACKFVVVPSEWYEPSPYVVLQSFAFGKPVVATNMGGLNDLITSNVNGQFFQSGNAVNLAEVIEPLFKSENLIYEMGKNARRYVETTHDPRAYYSDTIDVFKKIINTKRQTLKIVHSAVY